MAVTIAKSIGVARTFTTLQSWEDGAPANLTTAEQWIATTFIGTFVQGETVTGTGLTAGVFLDTNGINNVTFGITTGNSNTLTTLIGSTSGATCIVVTKHDTGIIWQGQCYNDAVFSGAGPLLNISGSTSSTTAYKEITTAPGQSFIDNANIQTNALRYNTANGVSLTSSGNYGSSSTILVSEANSVISKLQIEKTANSSAVSIQGANVTIDKCILETNVAGAGSPVIDVGGSSNLGTVKNCLIISRNTLSVTHIVAISLTTRYYNSTIVSVNAVATNGFAGNYGTSSVVNCAVFNVSAMKTGGSTVVNYSNSATELASPPSGFTVMPYNTTTGSGFQNITDATRDFRIKNTSALINIGSLDTVNATTDIALTPRPQGKFPDIGCWEIPSPPRTQFYVF